MAKRGRKKGGLNVNEVNDRGEIIGMIINQINSLNKKIKGFKNSNIDEHLEFVKHYISEDMGQFTPNGTLSKSKVFYDGKNTVWLKKTLATLHKINNHEIYGTEKKYKTEMTKSMNSLKSYVENYLRDKGYNENFIFEVTNSKDFYVKLYDEFGNVGQGYESNQSIDKIALSYEESGYSEKEKNRILNNIEYSRNTLDRLEERQRAFEEFERNYRKR